MSVKLMGQVWELDLPHNHQAVALALADHGDDDGSSIYPSQSRVAWKTGYTERQVRTILRELENAGLIVAVSEASGHRPTEYRMDVAAVAMKPPYQGKDTPSAASRRRAEETSGRKPGTPRAEVSDAQGGSPFPPNHQKEPSINHQLEADASNKAETDPEAIRLCQLLASLMRRNEPGAHVPTRESKAGQSWIRDMRLLIQKDRDGNAAEVEAVICWCQHDEFWRQNILSPAKLRKQFSRLKMKQKAETAAGGLRRVSARDERTQRRLQVIRGAVDQPTTPQLEEHNGNRRQDEGRTIPGPLDQGSVAAEQQPVAHRARG